MSFLVVEDKENYFISDLLRLCGRSIKCTKVNTRYCFSIVFVIYFSFSEVGKEIKTTQKVLKFELK